MSLFLLNSPAHDGALQQSMIATHSTQPLIATGWHSPCSVLITDNEGEILTTVKQISTITEDVVSLAWHPTGRLLALGWKSGALSVWKMPAINALGIEEQGCEREKNPLLIQLGAQAAVHTEVEEAVASHGRSAVVHLRWTAGGQYLLSSTVDGLICMWVLERVLSDKEAEQPGFHSPTERTLRFLWSTKSEGPLKEIILFPHFPSTRDDASGALGQVAKSQRNPSNYGKGELSAQRGGVNNEEDRMREEDEICFIITNGGNRVYALNEDQRLRECAKVEDSILSVVVDPLEHLLVILSSRHMIDVLDISDEMVAKPRFRRKLAITGIPSGVDLCMVSGGAGQVVLSSGDDKIRVLDLKTENMYVVPFPVTDAHITTIDVEVSRKLLVAGTSDGTLAVFQPTKDYNLNETGRSKGPLGVMSLEDSPSNTTEDNEVKIWEPIAKQELGGMISYARLSTLGDVVVWSDDKLHVLHKTMRMRGWDGVAAATQISGEIVVIESITGFQCLLKSKGKVRGVSISFPHIAIWNGSQIDVYEINESTSFFSLINFFPSVSPAFAIHPEGLVHVEGRRVVLKSFQGNVSNHITFTESEGIPSILNIMNDFVVAISSKNVLRLARIVSQDLKSVGPPRQLEFPLKKDEPRNVPITVSAACINAQGRRVALMTKVGPLQEPDSRIWVYDTETDKLTSFDFQLRNELPEAVYWNTPEPNANAIGELEYLLLACETHKLQDSNDGGTSVPSPGGTPPLNESGKAPRSSHHDDILEVMPDMENLKEKKEKEENQRRLLGVTNLTGAREHNIVTFFSTRDELAVHDSVALQPYQICLVGLTIPDFLLASVKINGNASNPEDYVIEQKRLRDFDGLKSDKDVMVREALMKFTYYSTIGNMDEAYRGVKSIKNPAAWQALARLCITSGRVDVAAVCLANIQDGVAARALREAREEYPDDKKVQLAILACSLTPMYPQLVDVCERLLLEAKRHDLMTDVLLACGKFEKAQRHSDQNDRIRIRAVAYKYAQFMESLQNMDAAILWYYNAKCGGADVPRIYYQTNHVRELQELVLPSGSSGNAMSDDEHGPTDDPQWTFGTFFAHNKELLYWCSQYSERRHKTSDALRYYDAARDVFNVVRLLCAANPPKIDTAIELVQTEVERVKSKHLQMEAMSYDKTETEPEAVGAAYFVGQHYEKAKDYDRALQYYRIAGAYVSGIRVSRLAGRYPMVYTLASASGDELLMLESAIFLEKKGVKDKAVALYRQIGATECALNLCIRGGLYDTLHEISTTLASQQADPKIFLNMAEHFKAQHNYQKAVEMLVFAKEFTEAINMCEEHDVRLTDQMAEAMTSDANTADMSEEAKRELVLRVANIAKDQGSWNLACKKFAQVGERLKAMQMLMRGGDVEKVIFFANHSRNAEMFTLAANFLQSQSWSSNEKIYRSIIQFYTKAKAFDSLLTFYDACAQMHIDERRNYPEALSCLVECITTMDNAASASKTAGNLNETKLASLKARVGILRSFVRCQELVNNIDPEKWGTPEEKKKSDEVISTCSDFIKKSRAVGAERDLIEDSLRLGDVFALLVKLYYSKMKEPKNALKVLESMPKHNVSPQFFLEIDFIELVCTANGKPLSDIVAVKDSSSEGFAPMDIDD